MSPNGRCGANTRRRWRAACALKSLILLRFEALEGRGSQPGRWNLDRGHPGGRSGLNAHLRVFEDKTARGSHAKPGSSGQKWLRMRLRPFIVASANHHVEAVQ